MKRLKHRCNSQSEIDSALSEGYDGVEVDLIWGGHRALENVSPIILGHSHHSDGPNFYDIDFHNCVVAINVKEYGLYKILNQLNDTIGEYFVFDVPGPEIEDYYNAGIRFFARSSEWELQQSPHGILIDSFTSSIQQVTLRQAHTRALISRKLRGLDEWPPEALHGIDYLITK